MLSGVVENEHHGHGECYLMPPSDMRIIQIMKQYFRKCVHTILNSSFSYQINTIEQEIMYSQYTTCSEAQVQNITRVPELGRLSPTRLSCLNNDVDGYFPKSERPLQSIR